MPSRAPDMLTIVRDAIARWEIMALFPAFVVGGVALGGNAVLWACAVVLPALYAVKTWATPPPETSDPLTLTRLDNRATFMHAAEELLARCRGSGRTTAVMMLQIDPLLMVEGKWSSEWPSDIMDRVRSRIGMSVRDKDIVAHCGDGTFGVLLHPVPRADLEITLSIVDRLQAAISEPVSIDGHTIRLTCAIGICLEERSPAPTGPAMVAAAECALRNARRDDEGAVRAFNKEMQNQVEIEHQLAGQVTAALDNGEIRPWFQPQVSTDTGAISGFEALARWHHPTLGVLTPSHFLPAIAASHAYIQLGEVVLLHSLKALQSWDAAGVRVPNVSVNLSLEELRDPRLADRMIWQVDRFDQKMDRICIEILETVTLQQDDDVVLHNLATLRQAGFRMDLDDFGTGHASIAHIARFGVGRIKIDRSFVTGVDQDSNQKRLISAILSMADQLGIETLAEGVESPGEHSTLAQLGCAHVQGFGISRPMPFEDTTGWATAHNAKLANAHIHKRRLG